MSAPAQRHPRAPRGLSRDRVVRAAADLVDERGVDALTLTPLAQQLGVTLPALYNHVRSAADCLDAVAVLAREELAERLHAAGPDAGDPLLALSRAWRGYAQEHPGRYAAASRRRVTGDPQLERATRLVADALRSVLPALGHDRERSRLAVWSLLAALHGAVVLEAHARDAGAPGRDEEFEHLLGVLQDGFAARQLPAAGAVPV